MNRVLISPSRYIQGSGAFRSLSEYTVSLGEKSLVICDPFVIDTLSNDINSALGGKPFDIERFGGECSKPEINRLTDIVKSKGSQLVIGVGGGKTLDTTKAVGYYAKIPVVIVPTIAATDAPCSALSVIYSPEGIFEEYLVLPHNPDVVLVDTRIIAKAPARFLVSGMGDALATWFEADACSKSYAKTMAGGIPSAAALSLARLCYDTLIESGVQAAMAVERQVVTPAVERIVEANTLLSGLGFESGGLAAAHAIHNGFTAIEATHSMYHGEKVAFSTIVQMVMEDRSSEEIAEVLEFCLAVGLPTTLQDLGIDNPTEEELMKVAETSTAPGETIHNMPFKVDADMVYAAIIAADALGQQYIEDDSSEHHHGGGSGCRCGH